MVILITAIEKEFDKKLAAAFTVEKHKVYAIGSEQISGVTLLPSDLSKAVEVIQKEGGHIDIYIDVTDERSPSDNFNVRSGLNEKIIHELYEANVIHPMKMLETFLPLIKAGEYKRLCYLTAAEASINETKDTDGLGYKMAKAGLHNFLQITRNVLTPEGFTIRVYDPCTEDTRHDKVSAELSAQAALNYFSRRRGIEQGDPQRDDEGNIVFRDAYGRQHTW
jgi:NAD(P)-dependent dehydrogenase (short-subunit alcohol dehydrogenase family)